MARRSQFNGIAADLLASFTSRYNDLNGYWALGQFATFMIDRNSPTLQFPLLAKTAQPFQTTTNYDRNALLRLLPKRVQPLIRPFKTTANYYRSALLRMMQANAMPQDWLADANFILEMTGDNGMLCHCNIRSDQGKLYQHSVSIDVYPHDPRREQRRRNRFGPSNLKGQ